MDAPTPSDSECMTLLAGGDERALAYLVERWQKPVLTFIYRYVQQVEAAQELTQETFVRLYQARHRYQPERPFTPWLFRIAANLARNYLRWRWRHPEQALPEEGEALSTPHALRDMQDPAHAATRREEASRVASAVAALPHALKVVVLLHYYEGQSYREIAEVVGCSPRGVETRLYRARQQLAKALGVAAEAVAASPVSRLAALW